MSKKKKISKGECLFDKQMMVLLDWAADFPSLWHDIGHDLATVMAAELLEKCGVIEIRQSTNQYRLAPRRSTSKHS